MRQRISRSPALLHIGGYDRVDQRSPRPQPDQPAGRWESRWPSVPAPPARGRPWAYEQNARKRYRAPTLKRLGLRYGRPCNTRHTYATIGLMAGANPAYMMAQMGHSLEVFLRVYAKWINSEQDARERAKTEAQIAGMAQERPLKKSKAP